MLDFLSSISTAITTLFSFLFSQVQNLFHLLQLLASGSVLLTSAIAFMPPAVAVFATAFITISVVFLIVGR